MALCNKRVLHFSSSLLLQSYNKDVTCVACRNVDQSKQANKLVFYSGKVNKIYCPLARTFFSYICVSN